MVEAKCLSAKTLLILINMLNTEHILKLVDNYDIRESMDNDVVLEIQKRLSDADFYDFILDPRIEDKLTVSLCLDILQKLKTQRKIHVHSSCSSAPVDNGFGRILY